MIDNDFEALQDEYLMLSKELFRNLKEKDETHEIVHLPVNTLGKISYHLYISTHLRVFHNDYNS
jgi:hypothetical protein